VMKKSKSEFSNQICLMRKQFHSDRKEGWVQQPTDET